MAAKPEQPYKNAFKRPAYQYTHPNTHKSIYPIQAVLHETSEGLCYNPFSPAIPWYETISQYLRIIYIWIPVITLPILYTLYKKI
jgi:hypothetical protein